MKLLVVPMLWLFAQLSPLVIPGERLRYEVGSSRMGQIGTAQLTTAQVDNVIRLTFETNVKVLLFKASDRTTADLDPERLRSLRYSKRERSPTGNRAEDVTIDYTQRTWSDGKATHELASDAALDELSMIFLVRSITLEPGEERLITRHFDWERNPVKLVGIADASEVYDVIQMTVRDPRQGSGVSVLRFFLTRDERRIPVRIESSMPLAGRITMILK